MESSHVGVPSPIDGSSESHPDGGDVAEAGEEGSGDLSVRCDALAGAIAATLGGVMRDFDARAEGAAQSQDDLALSIERLTGELDKLLEDAPVLFIMQHAAKISSIRKRVSALNWLLRSIQRRIDNIDRILSTGTSTDNVASETVETSTLSL